MIDHDEVPHRREEVEMKKQKMKKTRPIGPTMRPHDDKIIV